MAPRLCGRHCRTYKYLYEELPPLWGKILVCDCEGADICEADAKQTSLQVWPSMQLCVTRLPQAAGRPPRSEPRRKKRAVQLALMASAVQGLPLEPQLRFRQEAVAACFAKLYPGELLHGVKFPMIENLINQPFFTDYLDWRVEHEKSWDGPLGPVRGTLMVSTPAWSHRAGLPPL